MKRELADALAAGAMGFTTSRTRNHETADRRPVASRLAEWSEVRELVQVMGDLGAGIFEIAGEDPGRHLDRQRDYFGRLRDLGAPAAGEGGRRGGERAARGVVVPQAAEPMPDGVLAGEMATDEDLETGAAAPAGPPRAGGGGGPG